MQMSIIFIYITNPDIKTARRVAEHLLKKRLAGCANIFPIQSLYWWKNKIAKEKETVLQNFWYEYFYTSHFGLDPGFYCGKRVLDIGCGPRGSLEWANMAADCVGLDPLADSYKELRTKPHRMKYVAAPAELMPFGDEYFDVVSSFNSLDHVDDLEVSLTEIGRVLKPGGLFLLLTDVNHRPTVCEPLSYTWDVIDRVSRLLTLVNQRHYEKMAGGIYQSLKAGAIYDHNNPAERYGILSAKFMKGPLGT